KSDLRCLISNMKSMEQELLCPVCKDIVKQPIVLPCLHSVCLMCASEVLVQSGYPQPELPPEPNSPASTPNMRSPRQMRRPMPKSDRVDRLLRSGSGTYPGRRRKEGPPLVMLFHCAPCGRDVELGERGLAECMRNLTLERIVERYRHTVSLGSVAVMCQFCKPPQALEATKGCADCRASFCNECFKLYHPWGTPRAQHEHVQPTLNFRPKVLTCPEHDQERLQFYCKSCQMLLCSLCKLRRIHAGHKIAPVTQAYQTLKVCFQFTSILMMYLQVFDVLNGSKEQLSHCVKEIMALLTERQTMLAQALESSRQRRAEALANQVAEKRSLLEHAGLMAFTQELLKENDPSSFVHAARITHNRLAQSIESVQRFSLSADPSFRHFQLDVSRELKLLTDLNFIRVFLIAVFMPCPPFAYSILLFSLSTHSYVPPFGALILCPSFPSSSILLKIPPVFPRCCLPPASPTVLNFYLDSRWGLHADRLVVSKEQRCARSVPGLSLLQAADRALTSCHLTADLLVGDVAITQGRHYWACSVEPGSYLVKVGVGLESKLQEWFHLPQDMASPRYDPDSGHDSGAEDSSDSPPHFSFLTMGMGKIYLNGPSSPAGVTYPLPPRLGVCLDFEKGRVTFYDAHSLRPLWEGPVDCSAPVCPAFCFIGGGALQLQELVANQNYLKCIFTYI
uniref:Tripartite motif containing 46b n=1 Tax=Sinocyclocheilus rhinocerous TaxID=307959 RepID=A0A673N8Y0_9TELE